MKDFLVKISVLWVMACLTMGTVRQKEDPVESAQTGPISLKQKLEEEKDGRKGAPSPSMTFYGYNTFMTTPAVDDQEQEEMEEEIEETDFEDDSWETTPEYGQESLETAVEDWWSEEDEESFSKDLPSKLEP